MDLEKEKALAKERIKYFKILPSKIVEENGEGKKLRNYDIEPGAIIELRPGEIESNLMKLGGMRDSFSKVFLKNRKDWDYRKPFNFYEWIEMQEPITFEEEGKCELYYEHGNKVLIGPWIKTKIIQLFASRKTFWDNKSTIVHDCKLLEYLVKKGCLKIIGTDIDGISVHNEQEIFDIITEKCSLKEAEDREVYDILHNSDFFRNAKIISATEELYQADYDEELLLPFYKGETWDISKNRELLLGMINQPFYEMLVRNAREIQGPEKDCLFEEEFENRIKVLKSKFSDTAYYQAIDDAIATEKILDLKKKGYNIKFDEYNPEHYYASGNIKYFSCFYDYYEEREQKSIVNQLADELTCLEEKRIFPEDSYLGRAYYQMKEQGNDEDIDGVIVQSCENNLDNFYPDGSVKYFWIDYYGEMKDFQKREKVLQVADELPVSMALELKKADELAEYYDKIHEKEEDEIKQFMRISSFLKRYQKAIKKMKDSEIPDEREFAKKFLEENKQHVRQKRLNDDKRVKKLTMDEMINEVHNIANSYHKCKEELGEELYFKFCRNEIDLDDVIQILSDVILTEDEAKCVAIAWPLTKNVERLVDNEIVTSAEVREIFPELCEENHINQNVAELVAQFHNSYQQKLKIQKMEKRREKTERFKDTKMEVDEVEIEV